MMDVSVPNAPKDAIGWLLMSKRVMHQVGMQYYIVFQAMAVTSLEFCKGVAVFRSGASCDAFYQVSPSFRTKPGVDRNIRF